jgi:hypothetical protein
VWLAFYKRIRYPKRKASHPFQALLYSLDDLENISRVSQPRASRLPTSTGSKGLSTVAHDEIERKFIARASLPEIYSVRKSRPQHWKLER